MFEQVVFYSLAALVVACSLAVVTMRNTVHSALMLGLSLAGAAGLFATLGADFLFAGQILVYVGGISADHARGHAVAALRPAPSAGQQPVDGRILICAISLFGLCDRQLSSPRRNG